MSLVRTDAAVQPAAPVAVETQHLVRVGESFLDDQPVETTTTSAVRSAVLGTVVTDVVDRQEEWFRLSAAGADTPVVVVDLLLEGLSPTSSVGPVVGGVSVHEFGHPHSLDSLSDSLSEMAVSQ